jgi:hypothetical protein
MLLLILSSESLICFSGSLINCVTACDALLASGLGYHCDVEDQFIGVIQICSQLSKQIGDEFDFLGYPQSLEWDGCFSCHFRTPF